MWSFIRDRPKLILWVGFKFQSIKLNHQWRMLWSFPFTSSSTFLPRLTWGVGVGWGPWLLTSLQTHQPHITYVSSLASPQTAALSSLETIVRICKTLMETKILWKHLWACSFVVCTPTNCDDQLCGVFNNYSQNILQFLFSFQFLENNKRQPNLKNILFSS